MVIALVLCVPAAIGTMIFIAALSSRPPSLPTEASQKYGEDRGGAAPPQANGSRAPQARSAEPSLPRTIEDPSCPADSPVKIVELSDGKMHFIQCTGGSKPLISASWQDAEASLRAQRYETQTGKDTTTLRAQRKGELVVFHYAHPIGKGDVAPSCIYADWKASTDWRDVVAKYTGGPKPDGPSVVDPPKTFRVQAGGRSLDVWVNAPGDTAPVAAVAIGNCPN
jgi:hypothetical protein